MMDEDPHSIQPNNPEEEWSVEDPFDEEDPLLGDLGDLGGDLDLEALERQAAELDAEAANAREVEAASGDVQEDVDPASINTGILDDEELTSLLTQASSLAAELNEGVGGEIEGEAAAAAQERSARGVQEQIAQASGATEGVAEGGAVATAVAESAEASASAEVPADMAESEAEGASPADGQEAMLESATDIAEQIDDQLDNVETLLETARSELGVLTGGGPDAAPHAVAETEIVREDEALESEAGAPTLDADASTSAATDQGAETDTQEADVAAAPWPDVGDAPRDEEGTDSAEADLDRILQQEAARDVESEADARPRSSADADAAASGVVSVVAAETAESPDATTETASADPETAESGQPEADDWMAEFMAPAAEEKKPEKRPSADASGTEEQSGQEADPREFSTPEQPDSEAAGVETQTDAGVRVKKGPGYDDLGDFTEDGTIADLGEDVPLDEPAAGEGDQAAAAGLNEDFGIVDSNRMKASPAPEPEGAAGPQAASPVVVRLQPYLTKLEPLGRRLNPVAMKGAEVSTTILERMDIPFRRVPARVRQLLAWCALATFLASLLVMSITML